MKTQISYSTVQKSKTIDSDLWTKSQYFIGNHKRKGCPRLYVDEDKSLHLVHIKNIWENYKGQSEKLRRCADSFKSQATMYKAVIMQLALSLPYCILGMWHN